MFCASTGIGSRLPSASGRSIAAHDVAVLGAVIARCQERPRDFAGPSDFPGSEPSRPGQDAPVRLGRGPRVDGTSPRCRATCSRAVRHPARFGRRYPQGWPGPVATRPRLRRGRIPRRAWRPLGRAGADRLTGHGHRRSPADPRAAAARPDHCRSRARRTADAGAHPASCGSHRLGKQRTCLDPGSILTQALDPGTLSVAQQPAAPCHRHPNGSSLWSAGPEAPGHGRRCPGRLSGFHVERLRCFLADR